MKKIVRVLLKIFIVFSIFSATAVFADGDVLIASLAERSNWNPMVGDIVMRDGHPAFTPIRMGKSYRVDGRYWFPQSIDLSEYSKGYLQVEIMVSDILMMDCEEATIEITSEDKNNLKWVFNIAGKAAEGKSPRVATEAGVWTLLSLPLFQHGWTDGGGIDFTKVDRFDFHLLGIEHPVDGAAVQFRNLRVVPSAGSGHVFVIIIIAAVLVVSGFMALLVLKKKRK